MKKIIPYLFQSIYLILSFFLETLWLLAFYPRLFRYLLGLWDFRFHHSPYLSNEKMKQTIPTPQKQELTYGEILFPSVEKVLQCVLAKNKEHSLRLVDLGSGRGKIVCMAQELGLTSVGIELNPSLIQQSNCLSQTLFSKDLFVENNFLKEDLASYDLVWMSSTCFTNETKQKLLSQLVSNRKKPCWLVSTTQPLENKEWSLLQTIPIWTTWYKDRAFVHYWEPCDKLSYSSQKEK